MFLPSIHDDFVIKDLQLLKMIMFYHILWWSCVWLYVVWFDVDLEFIFIVSHSLSKIISCSLRIEDCFCVSLSSAVILIYGYLFKANIKLAMSFFVAAFGFL